MKITILISVALVLGIASTVYSIPVQETNANINTEILLPGVTVMPSNASLEGNKAFTFEGINTNTQVVAQNVADIAHTNWTPSWFYRSSWFSRPDWGKFYHNLYSYFSYGSKKNKSNPPNTVPEPGTILLLGSGLIGLACISRKRMKS